ncbi:response regulator transcription factor [Bacillus luteolus]|uniref:Response regulator transcription factor n=1 Tax=Litchfieldia luteola TaxID=682179 RepID=A0ABR9QM73_9BACI|nr:response regulator transcription factor [Cytobacillus luteolus]MBE4909600.1 response regulator transcription factor [Cytobacillus luteolus]
MVRVLLIEDEVSIRRFVAINLERNQFEVVEASSGADARLALAGKQVDFVILDLMLPDIDGFELCEEIRKSYPSIPIIILSARGEDLDRVMGLELGADDYMVKPFNPLELVARIRSVLRRTKVNVVEVHDHKIISGPFQLDSLSKQIVKSGQLLKLTLREFQIMEYFIEHKNISISRHDLLDAIWGKDYFGDSKTVDVHIRRLREKIEDDPSNPIYIETVWGHGYRFFEVGV